MSRLMAYERIDIRQRGRVADRNVRWVDRFKTQKKSITVAQANNRGMCMVPAKPGGNSWLEIDPFQKDKWTRAASVREKMESARKAAWPRGELGARKE